MNNSYHAKIADIKELYYFHSDHVRWLNPKNDFDLIKEYFGCYDIHNDTDTYFGISLKDIEKEYTIDEISSGRLCAYVENNRILSLAGVAFCAGQEWEICAVSTLLGFTGNGFSKAVCSFIAKWILEHHHTAICETNSANFAMQAVLSQIGMTRYCPTP